VMSPVGVNSTIINDGVNGFLASETSEWVDKVSRLIDDHQLRKRLGKEARQTVISHYSVKSQQATYLKAFNQLLNIKSQ